MALVRGCFADTYKFLGVVEGVFYDSEGKPTPALKKVEEANERNQKKKYV